MRTEVEIRELIKTVAKNDDRVRAVLLTGSRADPAKLKDRFCDFDITYIVNDLDSFLKDPAWIDVFGKRIMLQKPEEMTFGERDLHSFHYLMLFEDENRIDLTLFPVEKLKSHFQRENPSILLMDKDKLFEKLPVLTNYDYLIKPPKEKEFIDCANEFWWVTTYVAKGLCRNEIIYAKQQFEVHVRSMFLKMIEWYIGIMAGYSVSIGPDGKNVAKYIPTDLYKKILSTYPDSGHENIWRCLFIMTDIFKELSEKISDINRFGFNNDEAQKITRYLKSIKEEYKVQ